MLPRYQGSQGSTATWDITTKRNQAPYWWTGVDPGSGTKVARDYANDVDSGNATLLDGHVNSTEFEGANPNNQSRPFGWQIGDYEIQNIPFQTYDIVIYFGVSQGQDYNGIGNFRYGADVVRPTDPSSWKNDVANPEFVTGGAGISDANALQFSLPETFPGTSGEFVPTGVLDEITGQGDVGNYVLIEGLTDSTFIFQTWGEDFTHLGVAGFQIRDAGGPTPLAGDFNGDGTVDAADYTLWRDNLGQTDESAFATGTGDGMNGVDPADYDLWRTNFGSSTPPLLGGGGGAVPEPGTIALLAGGLGLIALRSRRK